jgi:hypothetical protein
VFISYAHEDARLRQQLETHLKLLQREGLISTWHDQQIGAGTEWRGQINAHLNSAHVILLLISSDFLASDYCYDVEMRRALERHDAGEARVIPVILRPVDNWRNAPFAKLQALPQGGKPITLWRPRDRAYADVAAGIRTAIGQLSHTRRRPPAHHNRSRMLLRVRRTWVDGVLNDSLYGAALQALGLQERPDAVPNDWNLVVQELDRPAQMLPPDTSIVQVFDDADGELLILGEPGAGKTTLLLELTRALLDRADQYATLPIPVVFQLATWAARRLLLADWLAHELYQRYDIPRQIAQDWVTADQILPLLDGLDEVAAEHRSACVDAINRYRERRIRMLSSMVVTSRVADYDALKAQLHLRRAVLVQALHPEQIDAYLASAGQQLSGVRAALAADATLRALAASPLFLSMMTLSYQDTEADSLPTSGTFEERRRQLFATYVDRMFTRRAAAARYSRAQMRQWLGWLASTLAEQNETVLYLELMQPYWLSTSSMRRSYTLIVSLSGALTIGLFFGLAANPSYGLSFGLTTGLLLGLFFNYRRRITPVDRLSWSGSRALSRARKWVLPCGLIAGLFFGLSGWVSSGFGRGLFSGLIAGLIAGALAGLGAGLVGHEVRAEGRLTPNQGIRRSAGAAIMVGLIVALIVMLLFGLGMVIAYLDEPNLFFLNPNGLVTSLIPLLPYALFAGLGVGLIFGGFACLSHGALRLVLWRAGALPLRTISFLDYATERIFLRRVGGGYMFVHRLLQEHFAGLMSQAEGG